VAVVAGENALTDSGKRILYGWQSSIRNLRANAIARWSKAGAEMAGLGDFGLCIGNLYCDAQSRR